MNNKFIDADLGQVVFVRNGRAKNIIARKKRNFIQITLPAFYSTKQALKAFEELKPQLLSLKSKPVYRFFPDQEFKTFSFRLVMTQNNLQNFYVQLKNEILSLTYPSDCNFEDSEIQETIRVFVEKALRYEAKRIFPQKVKFFAEQHGFEFLDVKINKSRSRWGSCSGKKGINLSYFCMLLPEHLVDFVILHELCHTVEMNHGERFWALLDIVSKGRAKEFTRELKNTTINW